MHVGIMDAGQGPWCAKRAGLTQTAPVVEPGGAVTAAAVAKRCTPHSVWQDVLPQTRFAHHPPWSQKLPDHLRHVCAFSSDDNFAKLYERVKAAHTVVFYCDHGIHRSPDRAPKCVAQPSGRRCLLAMDCLQWTAPTVLLTQ
jgi:hypothetical protein